VIEIRAELAGQLLELLELQFGDYCQKPVHIHKVFEILEAPIFSNE
jgi:hypothetical protein